MRKVIVSEFLTLDGVMQGPGSPDEDRRGGFDRGGWQMPYFDDVFGREVSQGLEAAGGLLLGRVTYEIFAGYWPSAPDDPMTATMNRLPKLVASTTLKEPLHWQNSSLVPGDIAEAIPKLKEEPGNDLVVIGSGGLARALMQHDLVDEYRLMVHPIVLGRGARLFGENGPRIPLRLVETTPSTTGVLLLTYEPERR